MRFELAECEWAAIKPMLPISRGGSRVNDRGVSNLRHRLWLRLDESMP